MLQHAGDLNGQRTVIKLHGRQVDGQTRQMQAPVPPVGNLATGFIEHPFTKRTDQTQLLGNRDELCRRHHTTLGVAPAQQSLGTGQLSAVTTELRLIVQLERLDLHRTAQVIFQRQPLQRLGIHAALIELERCLARSLGVIHGSVSVFQQHTAFRSVLRVKCDTDTGRHKEVTPLQHHCTRQRMEHLLRHMHRRRQRHITIRQTRQQHGELIATHPGHGVALANAGTQPLRHLLEDMVTRGVAETVVDRLEAVEIQKQHRNPFVPAGSQLQGSLETILEQRSIGQPGQHVVVGQALDPFLRCLALADINKKADITDQITVIIMHRGYSGPAWIDLAGTTTQPDFSLPVPLLVNCVNDRPVKRRFMRLGGQNRRQLVDHLVGIESGNAGEVFVDLNDIAGRVGDHDTAGGVLEYRGSHPQAVFGTTLFAHIPRQSQQTEEPPLG